MKYIKFIVILLVTALGFSACGKPVVAPIATVAAETAVPSRMTCANGIITTEQFSMRLYGTVSVKPQDENTLVLMCGEQKAGSLRILPMPEEQLEYPGFHNNVYTWMKNQGMLMTTSAGYNPEEAEYGDIHMHCENYEEDAYFAARDAGESVESLETYDFLRTIFLNGDSFYELVLDNRVIGPNTVRAMLESITE